MVKNRSYDVRKGHCDQAFRYVRAKMILHAFMIELDQLDYSYPRKVKNCENLCTISMESCSLVASQILAEFRPERATYKTLHN